jgi:hypothetical protein
MRGFSARAKLAAKALIATVSIAAVVVVAARSLAPSLSLATLLFWCAVVVLLFLAVSILWAFVNLQLGQWVLRHGGTDPQWFWFRAEPPGLAALREQQRSLKNNAEK